MSTRSSPPRESDYLDRSISEDRSAQKAAPGYLRKLAFSSLGLVLFVFAITLTIDPYGVSPWGVDIPGINTERYMRHQVDRLVKPLDVLVQQPRTILIGTSRVNQGFEPGDFEGTHLAPAYNLGVDFANPTDSLALLETLLPLTPSVEFAVIEINFHHFFNLREVSVPETTFDLLFNVMRAQFSWSALNATLTSVLKNRSYPETAFWLNEKGRMLLPRKKSFKHDVETFITQRLDATHSGRFREDLGAQEVLFERIQHVCRVHDVVCKFVVLPYQPVDLAAHVVTGRWPDLERVKRFFLERGGVYDFTRFNRFTNEPRSDSMSYWQDINHFTPTVGRYIGHVLSGKPLTDTPANFGVLLEVENFDSEMRAWAAERDQWTAANMELQERIRAAIFEDGDSRNK